MKTIVVIPALNEAGHIAQLVVETARQPVDQVVVVDNGSVDNTREEAEGAGALAVSEPRRGYGYACAAGAALSEELHAELLVFMDGDYSSIPAEISSLCEPIHRNQADLVLGSRLLGQIEPGAMPAHQRFGNWLSARLMSRLYGLHVTDLGPFRAIRADTLYGLHMKEMTFGWPTEMTVKVARAGGRILEVPASWHLRRSGRSKVGGTLRGSVLAAYYILGVTLRYARGS